MLLQFKNEHIFFALESIWPQLNYKFKYLINELVTANPDDEYVQEVDVPEHIVIDIFSSVTRQPEGIAAVINQQMLAALIPQLEEESNLPEVLAQTGEEEEPVEPNEAARILIAIGEIDRTNAAGKAEKIRRSKAEILK